MCSYSDRGDGAIGSVIQYSTVQHSTVQSLRRHRGGIIKTELDERALHGEKKSHLGFYRQPLMCALFCKGQA